MDYNSIVVSSICRNEAVLIRPWLEHLIEIPQVGGIILIDNNSDDGTPDIIESVRSENGHQDIDIKLVERQWDFDFSKARQLALKEAQKTEFPWLITLDIDEFFNNNAQEFFDQLEINNLDSIGLPHVKLWDWNQLYFRRYPNKTYYKDGQIDYSIDKSTMILCRTDCIKDYSKPLHEHPEYYNNLKIGWASLLNKNPIQESELESDCFVIHADRANLQQKARQYQTSLKYEEGKKRAVYRAINPGYTFGEFFDFSDWNFKSDYDYTTIERKYIEDLGTKQINQATEVEHDFPVLNINVRNILPDSLKPFYDNLGYE